MIRFLFILLIALDAFAQIPIARTIYLLESYPMDGSTEVPVDSAAWLKMARSLTIDGFPDSTGYLSLGLEDGGYTLTVMGDVDTLSEFCDDGTDSWVVDVYAATYDSQTVDCLVVSKTIGWPNYFKVWLKVEGTLDTLIGSDSLCFVTESTAGPFNVMVPSMYALGESATGSFPINVYRQAGTTVYMMDTEEAVTEIVAPYNDYSDERKTRHVQYTVTGVPTGASRYYFWSTGTDDSVSDTVSRRFNYTRTKSGVPYGGVSR